MTGIRIPMTSSIPPLPHNPFGPLIITMPLRVIKIRQTAKHRQTKSTICRD